MVVWASVLVYAGALGVPEAVAYYAATERALRDRVWATGQAIAVTLGFLVTLAGWWLIPAILGEDAALTASTRWFLLWFAVPCLGSLCAGAWLQGAGFLRAFNVCRATVPVVHAVGAIVLFAAGSHSVRLFAVAMLVGVTASWVVAGGLGPLGPALAAGPSSHLTRRMLHYGGRVQFGSWANAANVRLDQLLLSVFAAAASLGVYVVAVSYASVLLLIPSSASFVMLPDIVRHHRAGTARACIEQWYRRLLWATLLAAAVLAPLGAFVVPFAFGDAFRDAVPLVVLLVPAAAILGMNGILSTTFRGTGLPEVDSKAEVVGLIVTIAALAALLPRYGVYGAAIASLLAYGSSHVYLARKAVVIFGVDPKSLCVPTRDDLATLHDAWLRARRRLTRRPPEPSVSRQEL
jgi:O-antigen/teichoic acid export membrane protein